MGLLQRLLLTSFLCSTTIFNVRPKILNKISHKHVSDTSFRHIDVMFDVLPNRNRILTMSLSSELYDHGPIWMKFDITMFVNSPLENRDSYSAELVND